MTSPNAQRSQHAALSAALFRAWVARANPGERLEYHRGFLTVDCSPASRLAEHDRRVLTELADAARKSADGDQVHLVQRRNGPTDFSYLAIKASLTLEAPSPRYRSCLPLRPRTQVCASGRSA